MCYLATQISTLVLLFLVFARAVAASCPDAVADGPARTEPYISGLTSFPDYKNSILAFLHERFQSAKSIELIGGGSECLIFEVKFDQVHSLAIKVPRPQHLERVSLAIRREARIIRAAKRADPEGGRFIIEFFGTFYVSPVETTGLAMFHSRIGTLDRHIHSFGIQRAKRSPRLFLRLWKEMALAVRSLHRIGIVHRDIKPSNFLLRWEDGQFTVQLIDLGLSTDVGSLVPGLEEHLSGSLGHMSENQLAKQPAQFSDDTYALITTFREMLMGESIWAVNPGDARNHIQLMQVDEFGSYYLLTGLPDDIRAEVPDRLLAVVDRSYDNVDEILTQIKNQSPESFSPASPITVYSSSSR